MSRHTPPDHILAFWFKTYWPLSERRRLAGLLAYHALSARRRGDVATWRELACALERLEPMTVSVCERLGLPEGAIPEE